MVNMLTTVSTSVSRESTGEHTRQAVGSGYFGKCSTIFVSTVDPQIAGRVGYDSIVESGCEILCWFNLKVRLTKIPRTWIYQSYFDFHLDLFEFELN